MDGVARLRKCRDETARVFGLGRDWMNADADVALPFAVDSQGHQSDSIYNAALTQDNMHLHTIFTSPNGLLTLVSVTPFWAVALKLVRYTKWDPGDVCLLLRNGTILSQVQWTPEMLETWLFRHCWEMGYKHYPPERKREMRLRIENALELMKGVWPDPHDKKEYPAFYTDKSYSPEGAMGGSKAVSGGPRKGWMWSLAGVQGDATGTGAVVAASAPAGVSSPPQDGSRHPSFTDFGHVSEWKKDGEEEKRKSRGRSKSRSRGQRPSPQPPAFGNPNREREREEDRKEKQPIFVPPAEEFSGHQQQWHSMNPNHAPVTARPRGGSYSPPDDDVHSHMAGMNIGSNIYRTERKSRNPNPWQGQTQKDVDAFNRDVEGLIYQASSRVNCSKRGRRSRRGRIESLYKRAMRSGL
ncbi:hypothetical protein BDQ17DRAFT_550163 [Cyathus striatus]|nr:hypothetical protein BDQ17DRAFT_550163 [Cyathus striatus]